MPSNNTMTISIEDKNNINKTHHVVKQGYLIEMSSLNFCYCCKGNFKINCIYLVNKEK